MVLPFSRSLMNKRICASQNREVKTLPADVCIFGCFGWLSLAAVHSADCRFDSEVNWRIHVSSIVTYLCKNFFCCTETVANNALNCWHFVFDRLWANAAPTLNTAFLLTNVHAKWWIHCLLIFSTPLLSHATSIYDWLKWVCGVLWCFPGQLPNLGDPSVQHLKSAYHLLTIASDRAESE